MKTETRGNRQTDPEAEKKNVGRQKTKRWNQMGGNRKGGRQANEQSQRQSQSQGNKVRRAGHRRRQRGR